LFSLAIARKAAAPTRELLGDFEVLATGDGEKGCEMAVGHRPDIILMDLEMQLTKSAAGL
jgi:DNA-binding NarL/FixJ family response regulator